MHQNQSIHKALDSDYKKETHMIRKRHKHNLSHFVNTTFDIGKLIPIANVPVLPGDTIQHSTTALLRLAPMVRPVMHPMEVRIHHYFAPYRILWDGWEDFITGDSATAPPQITGGAHGDQWVSSYLGVYDDASNNFNALHNSAYASIYNNFYRDQDLITEAGSSDQTVRKIAWEKDRFTAARPWTQKGTAVSIPLGTSAPVVYGPNISGTDRTGNSVGVAVNVSGVTQATYDTDVPMDSAGVLVGNSSEHGLKADLSNATGPDVVDFREALAIHTYQENAARYGSDYVDYLARYGVKPRDGRLSRPEYLGGGKQTIQISEVLNQGDLTGDIGEMYGHGIVAVKSNMYRRYIEEHGVIMTLMSVRPKSMYANGLPKEFSKQTKEDYFQYELEHVGQQEVLNKEVYSAHTTPNGTFGYQNRYDEYRKIPSYATGKMTQASDDDWGMWRIFSSDPALNQTFVECTPNERIFADASVPNCYVMANHNIVARRPVKVDPQPMLR